jgi:Tol biopolymer transport system component
LNADNAIQITDDPDHAEHPAWSPDGEKIVFESARNGNRSIWMIDKDGELVNGNEAEILTDNGGSDYSPEWNPVSDEILFWSNRESNMDDWYIYSLDLTNGNIEMINCGFSWCFSPNYSKDGNLITFVHDSDIWIMKANGDSLVNLTNDDYTNQGPVFSPDGSQIAFYSERGGVVDIWTLNIENLGQNNITNSSNIDMAPSWSPDGTKIAFQSNRTGNNDIWTIDLTDLTLIQLTDNSASDFNCAWSPNGEKIIFTSSRDGNDEVWCLDLETVDNDMQIDYKKKSGSINAYPNPFNPQTTICYYVPKAGSIELAIFNSKGQKVAILVNEKLDKGSYSTDFNASELSSGIYFCILKNNNAILLAEKLVLLK